MDNLIQTVKSYTGNIESCSKSFLEGGQKGQSIQFFKKVISDIFSSLSHIVSELELSACILNDYNLDALEKYQKMIDPSDEYKDYFYTKLSYLNCL